MCATKWTQSDQKVDTKKGDKMDTKVIQKSAFFGLLHLAGVLRYNFGITFGITFIVFLHILAYYSILKIEKQKPPKAFIYRLKSGFYYW